MRRGDPSSKLGGGYTPTWLAVVLGCWWRSAWQSLATNCQGAKMHDPSGRRANFQYSSAAQITPNYASHSHNVSMEHSILPTSVYIYVVSPLCSTLKIESLLWNPLLSISNTSISDVSKRRQHIFWPPLDKSVGWDPLHSVAHPDPLHSVSHPDGWVQNIIYGRRVETTSAEVEVHGQAFHTISLHNGRVSGELISLTCVWGCVACQFLRRIQMQSQALLFPPITE